MRYLTHCRSPALPVQAHGAADSTGLPRCIFELCRVPAPRPGKARSFGNSTGQGSRGYSRTPQCAPMPYYQTLAGGLRPQACAIPGGMTIKQAA